MLTFFVVFNTNLCFCLLFNWMLKKILFLLEVWCVFMCKCVFCAFKKSGVSR